jgi:hypothetical protein
MFTGQGEIRGIWHSFSATIAVKAGIWRSTAAILDAYPAEERLALSITLEFRQVNAQERLAHKRRNRLIRQAARAGKSQVEIAKLAELSQPQVGRILKADDDSAETPMEILDRRDAGEIDSAEMMTILHAWPYSFGHAAVVNGVDTDHYRRGSWDDIARAYQQQRLTFAEYAELMKVNADKLTEASAAE